MLCCSRFETPFRKTPVGIPFFNLLLFLLTGLFTTTLSSTGLLPADTARAATTERRGEGEVNVLLGVETDHVRRHVDNLLADTVTSEISIPYRLPAKRLTAGSYRM